MGPIQTWDEFIDLLRRRAAVIVLVAVAGVLASVYYAVQHPHVYQATAVIQIESPTVVEGASTAAATESAARRLQLIEQRLMVRDNLLGVIAEYGLYADLGLSDSEKVALLRESTTIESIAAVSQGFVSDGTVSALIITARLGTPEQAAMVANDFAANVMEQGARVRGERTEATLAFFAAEEQRLGVEIEALEAEISAYKRENAALLPDSLMVRRGELNRLQGDAQQIDVEIAALERERAALGENPSGVLAQRQSRQLNERIVELAEERAVLTERIAAIEATIRRMPEVERTLSAFERRMEQLQEQFRLTTQRRADAEIGQRLETDQQAERFEILERAIPPEHPEGPSRRKIAAAGAGASVLAAVGVAFLLDLLNPVIRSAAQMQRQLDLRPVVSIPYVRTPWERRRQNLLRLVGLVIAVLALLLAAGLSLAAESRGQGAAPAAPVPAVLAR
jgi:tyrosine-protein kinase Etk/Wzc